MTGPRPANVLIGLTAHSQLDLTLTQARVRGKSLAEQGDDAQQSTRKEAASDAGVRI